MKQEAMTSVLNHIKAISIAGIAALALIAVIMALAVVLKG